MLESQKAEMGTTLRKLHNPVHTQQSFVFGVTPPKKTNTKLYTVFLRGSYCKHVRAWLGQSRLNLGDAQICKLTVDRRHIIRNPQGIEKHHRSKQSVSVTSHDENVTAHHARWQDDYIHIFEVYILRNARH